MPRSLADAGYTPRDAALKLLRQGKGTVYARDRESSLGRNGIFWIYVGQEMDKLYNEELDRTRAVRQRPVEALEEYSAKGIKATIVGTYDARVYPQGEGYVFAYRTVLYGPLKTKRFATYDEALAYGLKWANRQRREA